MYKTKIEKLPMKIKIDFMKLHLGYSCDISRTSLTKDDQAVIAGGYNFTFC